MSPGSNLRLFQASEGGKGLWGWFPAISLDLDVTEGLPDEDTDQYAMTTLALRASRAIQDVLGDGDHGLTIEPVRVIGRVDARVQVTAVGWAGRASLIRYIRAVSSMGIKFRPGVIQV